MGHPLSQLQIDDFDIAILVPGHRYWKVGSPFVFARGDPLRQATDYSFRPGQPIYAVYPAWAWLAFKTSTFIAFLRAKLLVGV